MCGIFGFASNKNDKKFAVDKFAMLGIFNDKRGGDPAELLLIEKSIGE